VTVFEFIRDKFPEFEHFTSGYPDSYRTEMNYGMAIRALEFAQELKRASRHTELKRLFEHVEAGMSSQDVESPLCIDFVQRIPELPPDDQDVFLDLLGPLSRKCYDCG